MDGGHNPVGATEDVALVTLDSAGDRHGSGWRRMLIPTALALLVGALLTAVRSNPGETEVYGKAARRLVSGEAVYRPDEMRAFTYPPFFTLPYVPFEMLPEFAGRTCWYAMNLLLLAWSVRVVHRGVWGESAAADRSRRAYWCYLFLVVVLAGRFVISPIEYQSHDLIVFALVLAAVVQWDSRRGWAAGVFAGLATACKATPLLFLPVLAVQRRWSACGAFVAALVAATFLPDVLFPQSNGQLLAVSWYEGYVSKVSVGSTAAAEGAWESWNHLNQSLAGTLYRLFTEVRVSNGRWWDVSITHLDRPTLKAVTTGLQGLIFGVVLWVAWRGRTSSRDPRARRMQQLGEAGVVLAAMVLLSPMSSKQHFCTLLVPVAYCAADVVKNRLSRGVVLSFAAVFLLGTLGVKDLVGRSLGNQLLATGSLTWCALALLLGGGGVLIQRRRAEQELANDAREIRLTTEFLNKQPNCTAA